MSERSEHLAEQLLASVAHHAQNAGPFSDEDLATAIHILALSIGERRPGALEAITARFTAIETV